MADEATGTEGGTEDDATGTNEATSASTDKTFSQEQLDAIVKDRLARERAKYADYEELQKAKAKLDEIEQAGASELEKAQKAREQAEADASKIKAQAQAALLKASVLTEAAKHGVTKTELLFRALDHTALSVADDGTVSGVEEAVKSFIGANPEFVGKTKVADGDQGARGSAAGQITQEQLEKMSPQAVDAALREGKLDHLLGG